MSPDFSNYLALLAGYLIVAGLVFFWIWRASRRRIANLGLRLALRAFVLALFFAPGAAACGGAAFVPFVLMVTATASGLVSPNVCVTPPSWFLLSFVLTFTIVAIVLYVLDRLRHR